MSRSVRWTAPALVDHAIVGAALGAWLTTAIDTRVLLIVTALLLGWQAISILRTGERRRAGGPPRRGRGRRAPARRPARGARAGSARRSLARGDRGRHRRAHGRTLAAVMADAVAPGEHPR